MVQFAEIVAEDLLFTLGWYDAEHTILILDVGKPWYWEDAYRAIDALNRAILAENHDICSIYYLHGAASILPKRLALPNIGRLLAEDVENERKIVFVGSPLLQSFIDLTYRTLRVKQERAKFHFAKTLDEAIAIGETVRAAYMQKQASISNPPDSPELPV
ncbi:MAG: hypothetical protein KC496_13830 [Anaerolineae bacterium]|nr:hypothetical protein [Anaerolineae bacterium]